MIRSRLDTHIKTLTRNLNAKKTYLFINVYTGLALPLSLSLGNQYVPMCLLHSYYFTKPASCCVLE